MHRLRVLQQYIRLHGRLMNRRLCMNFPSCYLGREAQLEAAVAALQRGLAAARREADGSISTTKHMQVRAPSVCRPRDAFKYCRHCLGPWDWVCRACERHGGASDR